MKIKLLIISFFMLKVLHANAQGLINVAPNQTANTLAQTLSGQGVTVFNAVFNNCDTNANGLFNVVTSNIGLDSGIILTSGDAAGAFGPSTVYTGVNSNYTDPDLGLLTTQTIQDACVLEFDFIPTGDTIKFNYIFGSAEYETFTCSSYEDIFGFFVSGPGITGPFTGGAKNIAYLPGTTCPVTINSVNSSTANPCGATVAPCAPPNNALFVNNLPTGNTLTGMGYNGYTLPIQAITNVIPCQTYHMKLAIADATDQSLDTGVMLEAGSLSSNSYSVSSVSGLSDIYPYIVEGCDTAVVSVKRKIYNNVAFADTISVSISGSAQMGIDYPNFPSNFYFTNNVFDTVQTALIYAVQDGITEGIENILISISGGCNNNTTDTILIEVRDSLYITLSNTDKAICLGDSIIIAGQADTNIQITWLPSLDVANANTFYTYIKPSVVGSQTYTVGGNYLTCPTVQRSFTITTDPIPVINNITREICEGDTAHLIAQINPLHNYQINWNPINDLVNVNDYYKIYSGNATATYTITAISANANCSATNTAQVTVWPFVEGSINGDTLVCDGIPVPLFVSGGIGQYLWSPATSLSCSTCNNPIATSFGTTTYTVILIEPHGCQDTLYTTVENHPAFNLQLLDNDTIINYGDEVELNAIGAPFYAWNPTVFLSSSINGTTVSAPTEDVTYVVTGYSALQGCPQYDTISIRLKHKEIFMPNAFTPNGDGINDVIRPVAGKQIRTQEFIIYNRWGQEVYNSNSIYEGWNGKVGNRDAEVGTYFYSIKVNYPSGLIDHYKGTFDLIR